MTHWTGRAIHQLRRHAGISHMSLAFDADVAPATVGHVETGSHQTSIATVERILNVLGWELEIVPLDGEGEAMRGKDGRNGQKRVR